MLNILVIGISDEDELATFSTSLMFPHNDIRSHLSLMEKLALRKLRMESCLVISRMILVVNGNNEDCSPRVISDISIDDNAPFETRLKAYHGREGELTVQHPLDRLSSVECLENEVQVINSDSGPYLILHRESSLAYSSTIPDLARVLGADVLPIENQHLECWFFHSYSDGENPNYFYEKIHRGCYNCDIHLRSTTLKLLVEGI